MIYKAKRLIVNADDFGLTKGINRGIIEAFKWGTLTSASLMANMPAFDDAILQVKENRNLGVGVHLNMLRGRPLLPASSVPTLSDRDGYFFRNIGAFISRLVLRKIDLAEMEKELRAQVERVLKSGITITHFDSEKHLHCHPKILKVVIKIANDYKIRKLRYIDEKIIMPSGENRLNWFVKTLKNKQYYKSRTLTYLCRMSKRNLDENGIFYPDHFYGVMCAGHLTKKNYMSFLTSLDDGTYEFACHPGYIDNDLLVLSEQIGNFYINEWREEELRILLDVHLPQQIKQLGIKLVNYAQL